ncbi:hypothetical protein MMC07_002021 [Pseudocyphellaria aurata]|nr:hypothetical protein [Pseudocyphellaria aurata]
MSKILQTCKTMGKGIRDFSSCIERPQSRRRIRKNRIKCFIADYYENCTPRAVTESLDFLHGAETSSSSPFQGIADDEWNVEPHLVNEEAEHVDLECICGGSNEYEDGMILTNVKHIDPESDMGTPYDEGSRSAVPQYDTARWQISECVVAHSTALDHFHRVPLPGPVANLFSAHLQLSNIKHAGLGEARREFRTCEGFGERTESVNGAAECDQE